MANGRRIDLLGDESGAAPAVEFLTTLPAIVLLVAVVVESTLLLMAKGGVGYAAFAAARSASAWTAARPDRADDAARRAAVQALVPFASGDPAHLSGGASGRGLRYASRTHPRFPSDLVAARYTYAERAVTVDVRRVGTGAEATVTYLYPFRVALLGRLFGERAPWAPAPRTFVLRTTSRVPTALPAAGLGIDYEPRN
jgi:hypothetical protein